MTTKKEFYLYLSLVLDALDINEIKKYISNLFINFSLLCS